MTADAGIARELRALRDEISALRRDRSPPPAEQEATAKRNAKPQQSDPSGADCRDAKDMISGLISNLLDAAAQKLLVPAVLAIVKGLRSRHNKTDQPGSA